ncbi:MAG TPA: carbohydrate ABC transporter permease [Candidatus Limnocylindrales bacterium]|nr:carbohydrate ABC transporter permease [Candidatus Limnocylindrales bacterium]
MSDDPRGTHIPAPAVLDASGSVTQAHPAGVVSGLPGRTIDPDAGPTDLPGDKGARWRRRIAYALMIGYALLMFVPFAWTVVTSLKTLPDSVQLTLIPDPITFEPWQRVFTTLEPNIVRMFFNSAVIAIIVTVSNVVLGSLAGYAFARLRFPLRNVLFLVVLATLMIPDQLRMLPIYVMFNAIGLTRGVLQYAGVALVLAISATSVFLLRQYFLTIPKDLEEAARIDGAGHFTTFLRVMLPLASPAIAAVTILQFQGTWNSFFWPVVLIRDSNYWTLPVGLTLFRLTGGMSNDWPPLMATVVIATIPILILYMFFQRYFVEGVAASGVKG